jgi:hypothetical protein
MTKTLCKLALVLALAAATIGLALGEAVLGPSLTSIGTLAFGADGTLFAADPSAARFSRLTSAPPPRGWHEGRAGARSEDRRARRH